MQSEIPFHWIWNSVFQNMEQFFLNLLLFKLFRQYRKTAMRKTRKIWRSIRLNFSKVQERWHLSVSEALFEDKIEFNKHIWSFALRFVVQKYIEKMSYMKKIVVSLPLKFKGAAVQFVFILNQQTILSTESNLLDWMFELHLT